MPNNNNDEPIASTHLYALIASGYLHLSLLQSICCIRAHQCNICAGINIFRAFVTESSGCVVHISRAVCSTCHIGKLRNYKAAPHESLKKTVYVVRCCFKMLQWAQYTQIGRVCFLCAKGDLAALKEHHLINRAYGIQSTSTQLPSIKHYIVNSDFTHSISEWTKPKNTPRCAIASLLDIIYTC